MAVTTITQPQLVVAVQRVLSEHGPLHEGELLAVLAGDGLDLGAEPDERLADLLETDDVGLVIPLASGRLAFLPALLDGRVFTHRLSDQEIVNDLLDVVPDLEPLSLLTDDERWCLLADGSPLAEVLVGFDNDLLNARGIPFGAVPPDGGWLLPPGRLRQLGCRPGDVIGVTVTADGLALARVDGAPAALGNAEQHVPIVLDGPPGEPQLVADVVWTMCEADVELFRFPLPPLGELFTHLGLVCEGEQVAPEGFDFAVWRLQRRCTQIAEEHRLSEDEALAVVVLATMYERFDAALALVAGADDDVDGDDDLGADDDVDAEDDPYADDDADDFDGDDEDVAGGVLDAEVVASTLEFLHNPAVAEALLRETIGIAERAAALGLLADALEDEAPRRAKAALRWLRGKANERLGRVAAAEEDFQEALTFDTEWRPALFDLARYASDRGDAEHGLALLRRADVANDVLLVQVLSHFRLRPRSGIGRNDRCWCGSGRKYKQCHLGNEQLPIEERAAWLYQKAGMYLQEGPWRVEILELAQERSRHWPGESALWDGFEDPLVGDALLFEGGAFEEFLEARGELLPDDERLVADQWLLVERSLYEVESTRPGESLHVRDVRTGDRHVVRERTASRSVQAGSLICCRIVPAGETLQIFGGIEPVPLYQRVQLMELLDTRPDPIDIVAFLSARFAPPTLQNTEGDPLVMCTAEVRIPAPDGLVVAFDETYDRDDSGPGDAAGELRWIEHVTKKGMERIRATLRMAGDVLHVETNGEARMDRVLAFVYELQPDAEVLSDERAPAADLVAARRASGADPAEADPGIDMNDPAIVAMMDEYMRQYETAWLDEQIPALAGMTPREAAADPTRRDDLARLLDSFPKMQGGMDPDRIRAALDR